MNGKAVRKARAIRMVEICRVLHLMDYRDGLTAYQLAFWVGLKPNANMYRILREAKRLGWLVETKTTHRPGQLKSIWLVTPRGREAAEAYHSPDLFRENRPPLKLSDETKREIENEIPY